MVRSVETPSQMPLLYFDIGQQEVNTLVRKLSATFPLLNDEDREETRLSGYRKKKLEIKTSRNTVNNSPTKKTVLPEVKLEK